MALFIIFQTDFFIYLPFFILQLLLIIAHLKVDIDILFERKFILCLVISYVNLTIYFELIKRMMRHVIIVFLCVLVAVSSAWRIHFGKRWGSSSSSSDSASSNVFRHNRACAKYKTGRFLSLLFDNACQGTFNDALDSACQCVGDEMKVS